MKKGQVVTIEDRIPKLKEQRRRRTNRRFIFYIFIFFFMLIVIIYLQSPISHVGRIKVTGNHFVSTSEIIKLSDLTDRTSFWKVDTQDVSAKITEHKELEKAIVKKELPNVITIKVTEHQRIAYLEKGNFLYPVLETGKTLSPVSKETLPSDAPILVDFKSNEDLKEMTGELSKLDESIKNRISEIYLTPEPSDPMHLTLYMNDGYQVSATIRSFSEKMRAYPAIVRELAGNKNGLIHLEVGSYFESFEQPEKGEVTDESDR